MSIRPRESGDPGPLGKSWIPAFAGMNGECCCRLLHRHLGEEIFHFEPQVRDGVIDRF
jgi:hypothetical protein